jgi:hypothetical protein
MTKQSLTESVRGENSTHSKVRNTSYIPINRLITRKVFWMEEAILFHSQNYDLYLIKFTHKLGIDSEVFKVHIQRVEK